MRTSLLLGSLLLTACVGTNAAYGDERTHSASAGTSASSGDMMDATTGSRATSASSTAAPDPTATEPPSEGSTSSSTGEPRPSDPVDPPQCEENGFALTVSGAPGCAGDSRFSLRACVELMPAGAVTEDRFIARTTAACGQFEPDCAGLDVVDLIIEASGHDVDALIDFDPLGISPVCGALVLEGVADGDDDLTCRLTSFAVFDPGEQGPRFGFSSSFLSNQVQMELGAYGIEYEELATGDHECKARDDACANDAGFRAIRFGVGPFAEPDGRPATTTVTSIDSSGNEGVRALRVYNFGSRLYPDCRHGAKWAVIHDALPYDFQP